MLTLEEMEKGNEILAKYLGDEEVENLMEDETYMHYQRDAPEYWFHADWNWLMKIVDKIEDEDVGRGVNIVEMAGQWCRISFNDERVLPYHEITASEADSKIEAVWKAVVRYVERSTKPEENETERRREPEGA